MNIKDVDLNLLRLFDAVWRTRSVSRAAQQLELSQPAASQGLGRLRRLLGDALFVRSGSGVQPTPRAERLAVAVQTALATLEEALSETEVFDPLLSRKTFRLHLSDIGEARFLPELMALLRRQAPGTRLESAPLPHGDIMSALDSGQIDAAIGFLPTVTETRRVPLLSDRYIVLLRQGHPFAERWRRSGAGARPEDLALLDFAAVRTHSDTLRILQMLQLDGRLRLTVAHFLSLPAIVRASDLGVLMPRSFAQGFAAQGGLEIIEPDLPLREFTVSLHWSGRFENDPAQRWLLTQVAALFQSPSDRA
ncbi:MAG: LysR family transcriptional regulator [Burkholderiaceae bacterium]|nr:LysR family transcriptional regulator [Burkholderiaceae bacterium]